jgi:hypothetical protein
MFWDYNAYPFNPDNDYIGNPKNSILFYPVLVCIEFLLILFTVKTFKREIRLIFKIGFSLLWFLATFISFIDTMRGGGVLAVHAIWLLVVSISLAVVLFIAVCYKNRKNNL